MPRHLRTVHTDRSQQPRWACPRTGCTTTLTGRDDDDLDRRRTGHRLNHDLADLAGYYPLLEDLLDHTRATAGGSRAGGSGGLAVPVNLTLLEFVDDVYLDLTDTSHPGVKQTVVTCERQAAASLGLAYTPRARDHDYEGHGVDTRILHAITWLRSMATRIAVRHELVADQLRSELHRLNSRAETLLYGARFSSRWSRCPDCDAPGPGGVGTVVSGLMRSGRMAVCVNYPCCHGDDGRRSCWRYDVDVEEWLRVPEPAESRLEHDAERLLTVAAQTGRAK